MRGIRRDLEDDSDRTRGLPARNMEAARFGPGDNPGTLRQEQVCLAGWLHQRRTSAMNIWEISIRAIGIVRP